jgi:hypothetical protein
VAASGMLPALPGLSVAAETLPPRGRRIGINLAAIEYWTTQFPFSNLMRNATGWTADVDKRSATGDTKAVVPPLRDGYPVSLPAGIRVRCAVAWDGTRHRSGPHTVLWDGDGAVSFPLTRGKIANMQRNQALLDVAEIDTQMWVGIDRSNPDDPVRNLRFLWPGTEATYQTRPFNPLFLQRMAPFSVLRFMDWGKTNGSPVVEWSDRSSTSAISYVGPEGVPLEVMVDLANTLHADPWFCVPHLASDDYVRQFALLVRDRLDPSLRAHVEYSNEVWNWGFAQTRWAAEQSDRLGLKRPWGTPSQFYAQRAGAVFRIVSEAFGAHARQRLVRVLAGQAAWTQFLENALAHGDTAANVDAIAIAPYFTAGTVGDPKQVESTLALSSDQVIDQMLAMIRDKVQGWLDANAALARKYKLPLLAYEAGPGDTSFYFPADRQDAVTKLLADANRNPRMKEVYTRFLEAWSAAGGGTLNHFDDIGRWSKWGCWGALEYLTDDPHVAPKYQALVEFATSAPRR